MLAKAIDSDALGRRLRSRGPRNQTNVAHRQNRRSQKPACRNSSPSSTPAKRSWSHEGETLEENLQTLCEACNLGKSNAL
ncbi:MAG: HNH endonuclease [Methylocystis sp.]|nr:HNH endonuclease [Methylocystis sp.]MBI3275473.1 HNH endonuclease [Methylocystis sp.]